MIRYLATPFVTFCLALPAAAATLRVPSAAFPTIQAAVDAAGSGDQVLVSKGIYAESVVVAGKTNLLLKGAGKPQIDGGQSAVPLTLSNCSGVTVTGFQLVHFGTAGLWATNCNALVVTKLNVSGGSGEGIRIEGGSGAVVSTNVVQDTGIDCISLAGSTPPSGALVTKNKVARCGANGIDVDGTGHQVLGNSIADVQNNGLSLRGSLALASRNKILRAAADGISLGAGATANTVDGNSVSFSGQDGIDVTGSANTLSRNLVSQSGDDGVEVVGASNVLERNKVNASGDDGFDLESNGNTLGFNSVIGATTGLEITSNQSAFTSNKVSACTRSGFDLTSGSTGNTLTSNSASRNLDGFVLRAGAVGNTLRSNKATTNADNDLRDFNLVGANSYGLDMFKNEDISPP